MTDPDEHGSWDFGTPAGLVLDWFVLIPLSLAVGWLLWAVVLGREDSFWPPAVLGLLLYGATRLTYWLLVSRRKET